MTTRRKTRSRNGNPARRLFEYDVVLAQVKHDKQRFIERINRRLVAHGDCLLHQATLDHKGYPRMSFRHKGVHLCIQTMRVIAILKNCAPLPPGYEAGHTCGNRSCIRHIELQHYAENAATDPTGQNFRRHRNVQSNA